jgi:hypothetical protein
MKSLNLFSVPLALCLTVALAQESQSQGIEVQDASPQATAPLEFSYVSASHKYKTDEDFTLNYLEGSYRFGLDSLLQGLGVNLYGRFLVGLDEDDSKPKSEAGSGYGFRVRYNLPSYTQFSYSIFLGYAADRYEYKEAGQKVTVSPNYTQFGGTFAYEITDGLSFIAGYAQGNGKGDIKITSTSSESLTVREFSLGARLSF